MDAVSAALNAVMPFVGSIALLVVLWLPFLFYFWRKNPKTAFGPPSLRRVARPQPRAVWAPMAPEVPDFAATLSTRRTPAGLPPAAERRLATATHTIPAQRTSSPDRWESPAQ